MSRSRHTSAPPRPPAESVPEGETRNGLQSELALDAIAGLLRTWGRHAFDTGELDARAVGELCERWARHVLVLSSPPGSEATELGASDADRDDAGTSPARAARRNWPGLAEFAARLRKHEQAYVTTNVKNARSVLAELVKSLGEVLADDRLGQTELVGHLDHLSAVIEQNAPIDVIKQEARAVLADVRRTVEARQRANEAMLGAMTAKLQSLRAELNEARREMELDPLTRLYNRKALDEHLRRSFELGRLSAEPGALLLADLDHFKRVNDELGHPAGDAVLRAFADCCVQTFPRRGDFVARYGGEEFAVVLRDANLELAHMLGERLRQAVQALRVQTDGKVVCITVSVGVAERLASDADPAQWLRRADEALYEAKRNGRNRVAG